MFCLVKANEKDGKPRLMSEPIYMKEVLKKGNPWIFLNKKGTRNVGGLSHH